MAPVKNGRYLFNQYPTGYPIPGETMIYDESQTIDLDNTPLSGGFLVKVLVLSVDPYLRNRMHVPDDDGDDDGFGPFKPGEPLMNFGVSVVLRSENSAVKTGDHVYGFHPFQQYLIVPDLHPEGFWRVLENKENIPWSAYVGVAGMPGESAFFAWKEYAHPKNGEVAFVTAGAGPVGATVVQLAKADGLKVIASAGSDEKVEFMKSIGADVAFNYRTTKTADVLKSEGPINIYWDNVGGETLAIAMDHAAPEARFIECGMITGYNTKEQHYPVKNLAQVIYKQLHIHGFLWTTLRPKYVEEFSATFPGRVARGEVKYKEYVLQGLEKSGQGLVDVLSGKNFGKCVIIVADE